MEKLDIILGRHPFFADMDPAYIDLLAGCAANVRFNEGQMLFHSGEEATRFYLIRHGSVALEIGVPAHSPKVLLTLGDNDVLGVSWLFPPYCLLFDARARTLVRAIALDATCLRGKCERDHDLGYELMKRFSRILISRLHTARMQLLDLYNVPKTG